MAQTNAERKRKKELDWERKSGRQRRSETQTVSLIYLSTIHYFNTLPQINYETVKGDVLFAYTTSHHLLGENVNERKQFSGALPGIWAHSISNLYRLSWCGVCWEPRYKLSIGSVRRVRTTHRGTEGQWDMGRGKTRRPGHEIGRRKI